MNRLNQSNFISTRIIASTIFAALFAIVIFASSVTEVAAQEVEIEKRSLAFHGARPGRTTLSELKRDWGAPVREVKDGDARVLTYAVEGFKQVQVVIIDQSVDSIVLYLAEPTEPSEVINQLGLNGVRPAPVPDQDGELLGQVFPERGVSFGFSPNVDELAVSHVVIEPLTAEAFVLRAEHDFNQRFEDNLADLEFAIKLDPTDARPHALRSRLLARIGRFNQALESANAAVRIEPEDLRYQLDRARLLFMSGDRDTATRVTKTIAERESTPPLDRALACLQLGNFAASGSKPDYSRAVELQMKAINLALPLSKENSFFARREAKRILFYSHFSVAQSICMGDWAKKRENASRWITVGASIGDNLVAEERYDPVVRIRAFRYTLEAMTGLSSPPNPAETVKSLLDESAPILAAAKDPLYKSEIQWEVGTALFHASRLQRRIGNSIEAQDYLNRSVPLLESADQYREPSPDRNFMFGQVYFLVGSVFAIDKDEHAKAVHWFDKAALHFDKPLGTHVAADPAAHGERLVSMGVSYWETGAHRQAMELTQEGLATMQMAVQQGVLDETLLSVPYGNLASMNRQLGYDQEAQEYAKKAQFLESQASHTDEGAPVIRRTSGESPFQR